MATLPVLFPMFFITGLLIELNLIKRRGVILFSYFAGFPTSARMISLLYSRGEITKAQATHMASYTSTVTPAFVILSMGLSMYGSVGLGLVVFASHIAGALINAVIFAPRTDDRIKLCVGGCNPRPMPRAPFAHAVAKSLRQSVKAIIKVGTIIAAFYIISQPFGVWVASVLEVTTGVYRAECVTAGIWRAIIPTAILSFGGLSIAFQGNIFLKNFGMKMRHYFLYKTMQTISAVAVCSTLYFVFL
jgi:hypothetical protein